METKSRTVIISDIHGCIDEFTELLKLVNAKSSHVRVICLGDLIDRGPDSVAVVKLARKMNLESVMGNHDYKFLKWLKSVGDNNKDTIHSKFYYNQFSDKDINYIKNMKPYIKIDNFVIVHAGLRAGISLENQSKDDLFYIRYMDSNSKFISLKKISKLSREETGAHFWTEFWKGPESIIYGHNVHSMNTPLIEEVSPGVMCYGLDTGCCFGGNLTALILESKEIVQVKAKKIYCESKFDIR
jgi:bis(5'-nucleosyl)-tetraphosphatase (symmetrical)